MPVPVRTPLDENGVSGGVGRYWDPLPAALWAGVAWEDDAYELMVFGACVVKCFAVPWNQ